jgi:addiction module HigA family antidote
MRLRLPTITKEIEMTGQRLEPIHPGEILEEEFMRPLGLSANALARRIDVPVTRISEIVRGNRGITADTALRLSRLFETSSELWLGLQAEYDLRIASQDPETYSRIVPLKQRGSSYKEGSASARSSLGEKQEPYGTLGAPSPRRDRRRIRRQSSAQKMSGREKRAYARLADQLSRSSDDAERKRLKAEIARLTFGG